MGGSAWLAKCETAISMLMVQVFATGLQILSRLVLNQGIFIFALVTYRHVVAALCVAPFAFFFELRSPGRARMKLGWAPLFWLFVNASTGVLMAMSLYYYGLRDSSATYATNFLNLVPVATFVLSLLIGVEKLGIATMYGKIRVAGVALCVAGAMMVGLHKGKAFRTGRPLLHSYDSVSARAAANMKRGTALLVGSCLSFATWFLVQHKVLDVYPAPYSATMVTCAIASLQSAVVGFCVDRRARAWRLGWDLQLATVFYSGALATAATFVLISRTISKKGPTYPAMFNPLTLVFVSISEAFFLGEEITLGSLIGMVMIIIGLYAFLIGKAREYKNTTLNGISRFNGSKPGETLPSS